MYVVITIINHCGDDLKPSSAFIMYYKWAKLFVKTEYSKYQVKLYIWVHFPRLENDQNVHWKKLRLTFPFAEIWSTCFKTDDSFIKYFFA